MKKLRLRKGLLPALRMALINENLDVGCEPF